MAKLTRSQLISVRKQAKAAREKALEEVDKYMTKVKTKCIQCQDKGGHLEF